MNNYNMGHSKLLRSYILAKMGFKLSFTSTNLGIFWQGAILVIVDIDTNNERRKMFQLNLTYKICTTKRIALKIMIMPTSTLSKFHRLFPSLLLLKWFMNISSRTIFEFGNYCRSKRLLTKSLGDPLGNSEINY